jgi:glutamate---cysteine ligase / carboxylate-amine ligase
MEELLEIVDDVVDELDSREEVAYVRTILENGTSADRQVAVYEQHGGDDNREEALRAVVDNLVAETREGVFD